MTDIRICPVCGEKLNSSPKGLFCSRGHSFDRAKEGYVNLLGGSKKGSLRGDSREMAVSRRAFLNRGYYAHLAAGVASALPDQGGSLLDICCGEGYYTEQLSAARPEYKFFGFDISKEMVRLAAKRRCGAEFFVANLGSIPVEEGSVDAAIHLFAPFNAPEFARVLKKDGVLLSVVPGRDHLMGLKRVLYEKPYPNDEAEPDTRGLFTLTDKLRVKKTVTLTSAEDIGTLFQMTPYYFKTGVSGAEKLKELSTLETETDFIILVYRKGDRV